MKYIGIFNKFHLIAFSYKPVIKALNMREVKTGRERRMRSGKRGKIGLNT